MQSIKNTNIVLRPHSGDSVIRNLKKCLKMYQVENFQNSLSGKYLPVVEREIIHFFFYLLILKLSKPIFSNNTLKN